MKTLALVLALAGLSQALQPGLEYQYRYKARVATGITEVNRQFAAAGIQGDVTIHVSDDYTTYFKFDNVEVAEMNEMLDCDLRKPLPMEYHPIQQQKDLLEKPFRVTVNGTQYPEHMESPEEPVWVTNIRKSVVNIFRIAPLWDHTGKVEQLNFGVEEEMLVGRCMNWYTSMKYPEHMADKFSYHREEYMEEDVQRGHPESRFHPKKTVSAGSSSVPLEENLWWVTRSTDFDTCHDFAEIRVNGNKHSEEVISRSSIGKYVIRGEEHRRLEQAVVEGTITVFTNHEERDIDNTFDDDQRYGYMNTFRNHERYDHIDTYTNQTIELKAVREIGSQMSLDYTPHHHYDWNYDIENPETDQYIPLDQLITGRAIDENIQTNIVQYIKKNLVELTTRMEQHPKHDRKLAAIYGRFVEAVNNLDYQHIESLHNELYAEGSDSLKLYIYHQALIYSGTMDTVRFATDKFKDSTFDDHFHMRNEFYDVMDHTVQHPHSINHIMELLMAEEESETHNFGLMSFSSLVHDMCLGRDRKHFYYDYNSDTYGHCDQEHIINDFIPFLDRGMKNKDLPIWRRLMYLQALSNLGTPHTINILKPYITGTEEEYDVFVRTNAIWALNAYNMHETAQDYVYKLLMPIMENKWEQFEIRNIAFLTLSTWKPNQSWWKRMAVMTWYDPSPQFTSFVYSTIDTIAHSNTPRNETAARVLHLCKPSSPPSVLHSENMFLYEYLFSEEMGTHVNFAWFASTHGYFPEEVALRLRQEVFYGYQTVAKFDLQQRGFDMLWNMFNTYMSHDQERDSGAKDMVHGVWNELKEKLGFETPTTAAELRLWAKFDRLIFLANDFPVNEDFFKNHEDMEFWRHIWLTMQLPHYFRFVRSYTAIATDVGLPFCVQYNLHSALWLTTKERSGNSFSDMKLKGSMEFVIDYSTEAYVGARTYIPWSDHPGISAGLYAEAEVILPFLFHATFDFKNYEFHLSAEPINDDKITLYSSDVIPYVMRDVNYPVEVHLNPEEYKRLFHDEHPMYHYTDQALPSDAGLWVETTREGDEYYYFNFRHWMREFRTTLHMNSWKHAVVYDPSASSTKSVSFTFNYMYTGEGQQDRDMTDNMQRISEIQQKYRSSNGNVRTINFMMELQGSPKRHYESSLTWSRSYDSSHANTKLHFVVLKDSHITCVNANFQKPKFDTFATMKEMFDADYHTVVKAELYDGENCDESPILEFEGSFDVSQEVKDRVQKDIDNHCEYNTFYPVIDVITSPVYDHAHFKANWNDNFPDYLKNMTYFVYDMARGVVYSKIDFDYTHEHEANKIEIDASRNLQTKHWTVRTEKPHEVSIIHDMSAPMWVDLIASPATIDTTFMYDFIAGRTPLSCSIEENKVRTFDGYEYEYHTDECWTTMAIDVSQEERGALMVRHSGHWEVRIIWQQAGMDFHITPSSFKINGEDAQGTDDRFTVHHYDDDSHTIDFSSGTRVRVSDKVEVLMGMRHRGHIRGLCGNFDGEPMNDLMGPKGCSYTDYQMFAQSWMTPMEGGCADYDGKVGDVHNYQGSCPHDFYQATGETYNEGMVDCTEWEYHERTEGNYHCKSLSPIPKCKSGCYEKYPHTEYMEYDCRYTGHDEHRASHSPFVEESYSHSYYVTYPAICITQ